MTVTLLVPDERFPPTCNTWEGGTVPFVTVPVTLFPTAQFDGMLNCTMANFF